MAMKIRPTFGKKGMFFTFMAVILVGGFLFLVVSNPRTTPRLRGEVERSRIIAINTFVRDVSDIYADAVVIRSTKNALDSIGQYMRDDLLQPKFTSKIQFMEEGDGFLNIVQKNVSQYLEYSDIVGKADAAHLLDIEIVIDILDITQTEPWYLDVASVISINVYETDPITGIRRINPRFRWNHTLGNDGNPRITKVPIEGMLNPLVDPEFDLTTGAPQNGIVVKSIGTTPSVDKWVRASASQKAPSYLQRFYDFDRTTGTFKTDDALGIFTITAEGKCPTNPIERVTNPPQLPFCIV